jgi:pimeloyl-ACP methyl ester carboxylesterase
MRPNNKTWWETAFPAVTWLRNYHRDWFRLDLVAGITLAAYLLPAALGDASLANLRPEAGLYACLFGDGIVAFSQTDFTEDLKKINVPVLVMHSEDDQIVPYQASGPLSAKLLKNGTLKTYKDLPHGMITTHADVINADLLAFFKS